MTHRNLTEVEIIRLESQGCICNEWKNVYITDPVNVFNIRNTVFSGNVSIGSLIDDIEFVGNITKPAGIYNSFIHECEIGNNVFINNVNNLAHYKIEDNVIIDNVYEVIVHGVSSFGNGTELDIINEGGGRTLKIFDTLSSQAAYIITQYKHDHQLQDKLDQLVENYIQSKTSKTGLIGLGSRIINCAGINNVNVGPHTSIIEAKNLCDGTIISCKEAPVKINSGVSAKHFIIQCGSSIESDVIIEKCFIGQAVKMGKQYSAENSAFFCNCEAFHGEAVSLFAGPYTVTHHKSTLLIAGLFSFFNAGSGTNQSNHMYKLGPIHQGILERGSKTGSFSYLLWPSRVGAYTAILGKHYSNFDTSDLPFSYINEVEGKSFITPAMNLFTVGTKRDSEKWPSRDRRKCKKKIDLVNFNLFNPYIVGRMLNGIHILKDLYEKTPKEQETVNYNGIAIHRLLLKTCSKYYEIGVNIFIGNCLISKLEKESFTTFNGLKDLLKGGTNDACNKWIDLAGMIAPQSYIENILAGITEGKIPSLEDLFSELENLFNRYQELEWSWCKALIEKRIGNNLENANKEQIKSLILEWEKNYTKLNNLILQDSMKEFDKFAKISFGIDGDAKTADDDFETVRGGYDNNKFVQQVKKENAGISGKTKELLGKIDSLG